MITSLYGSQLCPGRLTQIHQTLPRPLDPYTSGDLSQYLLTETTQPDDVQDPFKKTVFERLFFCVVHNSVQGDWPSHTRPCSCRLTQIHETLRDLADGCREFALAWTSGRLTSRNVPLALGISEESHYVPLALGISEER